MKKAKNYWAIRINESEMRQWHLTERVLSEGEVKSVKDYAWVDSVLLDMKTDKSMVDSWKREYRKQKALLHDKLDYISRELRHIRANTPISKGLADGKEIRNKLKNLIDKIENG